MAISLPWHSSHDWQPTEVIQFINHVNSGAGTLIVRTDAGLAYLKALGNPDGPHALVKDLLGTHLAAMLGLGGTRRGTLAQHLAARAFAANRVRLGRNGQDVQVGLAFHVLRTEWVASQVSDRCAASECSRRDAGCI